MNQIAHQVVPRLYIIVPPGFEPARLREFAGALQAAQAAAVLMRFQDTDPRAIQKAVKSIAPVIQETGAALLLDGHADAVAASGADGAHLGPAELSAVARLKPGLIAGAGRLLSRHDAMVAAEAGVDYVMFGEPDAEQRLPSIDAVLERVGWWSELFEIPCVGYADRLEDIGAVAKAGADFVAVGAALFSDPRGLMTAAVEAASRLAGMETAA